METFKDKTTARHRKTNGINRRERRDGCDVSVQKRRGRRVAERATSRSDRHVVRPHSVGRKSAGSHGNTANNSAETETWLLITAHSANGRWSRRARKVTARQEARTRLTRSPGEGKPSVNPTNHRGVSEPGPVAQELRDPSARYRSSD